MMKIDTDAKEIGDLALKVRLIQMSTSNGVTMKLAIPSEVADYRKFKAGNERGQIQSWKR